MNIPKKNIFLAKKGIFVKTFVGTVSDHQMSIGYKVDPNYSDWGLTKFKLLL